MPGQPAQHHRGGYAAQERGGIAGAQPLQELKDPAAGDGGHSIDVLAQQGGDVRAHPVPQDAPVSRELSWE